MPDDSKIFVGRRRMSRQEVVQAVTEPDSVVLMGERSPKSLVISMEGAVLEDTGKMIRESGVTPDSYLERIVRLFCETKKTTSANVKVLILRARRLSENQLKIVEILCHKKNFSAIKILKALQSVRKFSGPLLLALRAYVDLEDINPEKLNHFFINTLPQNNSDEVGRMVYQKELEQKIMRSDQYVTFYTACTQIEGIKSSTAIEILRATRKMRIQPTKILNLYLRSDVLFGDKPVSSENILNLVKLYSILPEFHDQKKYERLLRKLVKKNEIKSDFQLITELYKTGIIKERTGKKQNFFRRFIEWIAS